MEAPVTANLPRDSSTAAFSAEGSLKESDLKTNREIQRQIAEALAPLRNRSRYEGDEEVVHLAGALIPGEEDEAPLSPEPEPDKEGQADVSGNTPRNSSTAAHAAEGVDLDAHKLADIQRQIAEAIAPLKPLEEKANR